MALAARQTIATALGAAAVGLLAGSALAQDGAGTSISLSSHVGVVGGQRAVFVDLSTQNLEFSGGAYQVIVLRRPGWVPCPESPQEPWARGSQQLLYAFPKPTAAGVWGKWVAVPVSSGGKWTACGYVVAESNLREEVGLPYVLKRTEHRFRVPGLRRGEVNPWRAPQVVCRLPRPRPTWAIGMPWVKAQTPGACRRAITIARTWRETNQYQGGIMWRNGGIWFAPSGKPLSRRVPAVSFMRLPVPGVGTLACRIALSGRDGQVDVICGGVGFRSTWY